MKFRSPNLYTIIIVTKKKAFLNEKRVKGSFIFMTMLSFKEVESNYDKKEPGNKVLLGLLSFLIV